MNVSIENAPDDFDCLNFRKSDDFGLGLTAEVISAVRAHDIGNYSVFMLQEGDRRVLTVRVGHLTKAFTDKINDINRRAKAQGFEVVYGKLGDEMGIVREEDVLLSKVDQLLTEVGELLVFVREVRAKRDAVEAKKAERKRIEQEKLDEKYPVEAYLRKLGITEFNLEDQLSPIGKVFYVLCDKEITEAQCRELRNLISIQINNHKAGSGRFIPVDKVVWGGPLRERKRPHPYNGGIYGL